MRVVELSGVVALVAGLACGPAFGDGPGVATSGGGSPGTEGVASTPPGVDTTDGEPASSTGPPLAGCDPSFDSGLGSFETIWSDSFTARPTDQLQYGTSIVSDEGGLLYAVGLLHSSGDDAFTDGWLHAIEADGTARWEARYEGAAGFSDVFYDVAVDGAGNVIVVGDEVTVFSAPVVGVVEWLMIALAYSPSGELLWRTEIAAPDEHGWYGAPPVVAAHSDGRIVVGTSSALDGGWPQPYLVEIGGDGAIVETWSHQVEELRGPSLTDVRFDEGGVLHAAGTGYSLVSYGDVEWVGRWDADGSLLGQVVLEHEGADAISVIPREGGGLLLGRVELNTTAPLARRPRLHRYGPDGEELWTHVVEYPGDSSLQPRGLASDCDGRWLVLAESDAETWVLRLDDDGVELQRHQVLADPYWSLLAIATDPFGNPVVTGRALEGPQLEAFLVRKLAR